MFGGHLVFPSNVCYNDRKGLTGSLKPVLGFRKCRLMYFIHLHKLKIAYRFFVAREMLIDSSVAREMLIDSSVARETNEIKT